MYYMNEQDQNIVISKEEMLTVKNTSKTKRLIELENMREQLKDVFKSVHTNLLKYKDKDDKIRNVIDYVVYLSGFVSVTADSSYFITRLANSEYSKNTFVLMVFTNLLFGTFLFTGIKEKIKLDKQEEKRIANFSKIDDCINKEIKNIDNEQLNIVGDDIGLTADYAKIKVL